MPGFLNCPEAAVVGRQFPSPEQLRACWISIPDWAKRCFASLLLSEGVPAEFIDEPLIFEQIRQGLALRLDTETKQITVIGSMRFGYSLRQPPHWGTRSSASSDLDLAAISAELFDNLRGAVDAWAKRVEAQGIPEGAVYKYWKENLELFPRNIARGFIDPYKIPREYSPARRVGYALDWANKTLKETKGSPPVKKVTLRVYRDWEAFVRRVVFNLNWATTP